MPLLPAAGYNRPVAPSVSPSPSAGVPFQDIRAPAEAFGAESARALSGLGASLDKVSTNLENIQMFHDQVIVDQQKNSYDTILNNMLHGDPYKPGDVGYLGSQGQEALDRRLGVRQEINSSLIAHRSKLKNARQLHLFDQETSRFTNIALGQIGRHYDEQYNKHAARGAKDSLALEVRRGEAASNVGDFAALQTSMEAALVSSEKALRLENAPESTIANNRKAIVEGYTAAWAEGAIERNPQVGRQFVLDHPVELGDKYNALLHKAEERSRAADVDSLMQGKAPGGQQSNLVRGGAVEQRITTAAQKEGVDTKIALTIASLESRLGTVSDRAGSQYQGVFQLGKKAADSVGGREIEHGVKFVANVKAEMKAALGREPTGPELYLAHQQGTPGAVALINNPNAHAGTLVPRQNIRANGGNPDAPASAFVAHWRSKYESHASQLGGTSTAPTQPSASAGTDKPAGQIEPGNIDLNARPVVTMPDGKVATVRSVSINENGQEVLIPTVADDGSRILSNEDAFAQYVKTGKHLGKFDTPANATAYGKQLSAAQGKQYGAPPTPEAGIQSIARSLRLQAAGSSEPLTIRSITAANSTPENVGARVDQAVKYTGFGPDQPLDLNNPEVMAKVLESTALISTGKLTAEDKRLITRALTLPPSDVVAPTVAAITPPGTGMPALPPNEPGEFPDGEVPGLLQRLQAGAAVLPPNAKPELWNAFVRRARQEHNMIYNLQQQQARQKALAQAEADEKIGREYYKRMGPGSTNMPSDAEIRNDSRISLGMADKLINEMNAPNKPQPSAAISAHNRVEAYKRFWLPENDPKRISNTSQIAALMSDPDVNKRITWEQFQSLDQILQGKNFAKAQYVGPHVKQLLKNAEHVLFPLKNLANDLGVEMDQDGPYRELNYQIFVENQIQDYITNGKDLRKLFDPGSPEHPNPEFLGSRSIIDKYAEGAVKLGEGQVVGKIPVAGELTTREDVLKAWRQGRFGVPETEEAQELAKQYMLKGNMATRGRVAPNTGAPLAR